ncbi:FAD-dependent thymidylate synthase [bacterium]|nr:MAG: FAD-dependent thymidylate synthase [bacterium]
MQVYLVASTTLSGGIEQFLRDRNLSWRREDSVCDAELTVEAAGRVCYMSFGDRQHRVSTHEYIANIISQGHDSVLEHANFTLLVDGISRALSHQLVRHRAGFSYSQLSQQYHDESEVEFMEPDLPETDPVLREQWDSWVGQTRAIYKALLESADKLESTNSLNQKERLRLARSMARLVLPNATYTTLVITGNARAWRNFLRVRGDIAGDLEMRSYCVAAYRILHQAAPHLFDGFEVVDDSLGSHLQVKYFDAFQ